MLRSLRIKFVAIVMALVGLLLVSVLAIASASTDRGQHELVETSLARGLREGGGGVRKASAFAVVSSDGGFSASVVQDDGAAPSLLSMLVRIDAAGIVVWANSTPLAVEEDAVEGVLGRIMDGEFEGFDRSVHLAWMAIPLDDGSTYAALIDISSQDALLARQTMRNVEIAAIALVILLLVAWWLSGWALRPVQEAWDAQRQFVADASHELKTPLAVIIADLQILQTSHDIVPDDRRWVDGIAEESGRMHALVDDLLQLARADEAAAGDSAAALPMGDVDLSDLVDSVSLEFDAVAFDRGCEIDAKVEEGLHVTGNAESLDRLVRTLVDNACKYSDAGTVAEVSLRRSGRHAILSVRSHGTPVDPEDLPHLFERFYRSDKVRTIGEGTGFGLGLAIAKGIAEVHGGTISATSTAEDGTEFVVRMPLA